MEKYLLKGREGGDRIDFIEGKGKDVSVPTSMI